MNIKKQDIIAAFIIGEADALLMILIAKNIGWDFDLIKFTPIILPVLAVLGIIFANYLGKKILAIFQAAKFALTGTLNTFIDLGVLNLLMLVFGVSSGMLYSVFKGMSFIAATINSYLWNKFWTFEKKETAVSTKESSQFFAVAGIGLIINVAVASFVVNIIGPQFGIFPELWANIGGVIATLTAMFWNFVGYKFIVFKK
ncbi:GtrA family protein [Candidatus Parcubacteria bacterium]|nr:GtrA family protein [Candidatus Parcubacteria bacterium]